jgi:hypothetical protein
VLQRVVAITDEDPRVGWFWKGHGILPGSERAYFSDSIKVYTPFEVDCENPSVRHAEGGAVFRAGAAPVVEPGGRDVGVPQPLLDFAQIGAPIQGVGGRRGPQGVRAETGVVSPNPRKFRHPNYGRPSPRSAAKRG